MPEEPQTFNSNPNVPEPDKHAEPTAFSTSSIATPVPTSSVSPAPVVLPTSVTSPEPTPIPTFTTNPMPNEDNNALAEDPHAASLHTLDGVSTPDHPPSPWLQESQKKSNKKFAIVSGLIIAVVTVFGSGGWAAYALWYQSPDKIINDSLFSTALTKTLAVDGSIIMSDKDGVAANIGISGEGGYKEGLSGRVTVSSKYLADSSVSIGADTISTRDGDYFVKLFGLKALYDSISKVMLKNSQKAANQTDTVQSTAMISAFVQPFINKLDNQWIRFSASDIRKYDQKLADQYDCTNKVYNDAAEDEKKAELMEIDSLYRKYKILVHDKNLGNKDGNIGLLVHIDQRQLRKFMDALQDTELVKNLNACTGTTANSSKTADDTTPVDQNPQQFELWSDQWTHELKRIYVKVEQGKGDDKMIYTADLKFKSNVSVKIQAPSGAKTIDELFPELKTQLNSLTTQKA